jgi:hypothetical protein
MTVVDTPQSLCRLGIARIDVTPPVGIYHRMWGAAAHDRATGVHRPLTATALVFQAADGPVTAETEQALMAIDHCLLWAREMDRLIEAVAVGSGMAREQIVVTFGHTHAAGLMDTSRAELPGGELIGPYLDKLGTDLAQAVRQARAAVEPATINYGLGRSSLAANREFVCGFNPAGRSDDTVLVAPMAGAAGQTIGTVVNYACHPTTLAWQNTLISPDYPGAMREVVEQATGAPCVFIQGASGDLGPREGYVGDPAVADRNGRQLGYAALAALETLPPAATQFRYAGPVVSGATLGTWRHEPLDTTQRQAKARWRLRRWTIDLPRRADAQSAEDVARRRDAWRKKEQELRAAGRASAAAETRAMVERLDRQLTRIEAMPPGASFPLPVVLWQMGDAFWLAVEGEAYQLLQQALRQKCGDRPLVVATLANGARPAYLPPAEAYGSGLYQATIAMLAPGSLELLIEAIGGQLTAWAGR